MEQPYELMHKDTVCALMLLDAESGDLLALDPVCRDAMPFFGTADLSHMRLWWSSRAVPASR